MDVRDELEAAVARPAPAREPAATTKATEPAVSPTLVARAVADPSSAAPSTMLELQRLAGNASVRRLVAGEEEVQPDRSPVLDVVGKGGGQPLAPDLRSDMESRLGADFGDVRLHTDPQASRSAEAVNAHAYTVGSDVVFRSDRWNPDSSDGRQT
ncbi:MAG: eCIS core domain-containing protein, partial [Candidatus Limnocylindrales bacterium]